MMDNMRNLELNLKKLEDDIIDSISKFKYSSPFDYTACYNDMLNFCTYRGKGLVFNFDYFFYFKFKSGMDYVGFILDNYNALQSEFDMRSTVFLKAITELERICSQKIYDLDRWYEGDDNFSSHYYKDQINILIKYRDEILARRIDTLIMEDKLSRTKRNNKEELDRLFIDLVVVEHEIDMCNEVLYSVFNEE